MQNPRHWGNLLLKTNRQEEYLESKIINRSKVPILLSLIIET